MASSIDSSKVLRMEVDFWGFLKKEVGDLEGINILAYELIQNADDAKNEKGNLVANDVILDLTDQALVVDNDAIFREEDFSRIRRIANGEKRLERGVHATGAFGVGFLSVYQITNRPELFSAGKHWIFDPEKQEIYESPDTTVQGTRFVLPWAKSDSLTRKKLGKPPVDTRSFEPWIEELREKLPHALIFLKKLDSIELRRNGEVLLRLIRNYRGDTLEIEPGNQKWKILKDQLGKDANVLQQMNIQYLGYSREEAVELAIPNFQLSEGLLFATLPTELSTGLPFHLNGDFFPDSNRKSVSFTGDYRAEWNLAIIRGAARILKKELDIIRRYFLDDHKTFWFILERLEHAHRESLKDKTLPFGEFWKTILEDLQTLPIVYTQSGKWKKPIEARLSDTADEDVIRTYTALGIDLVHDDLRRFRNILSSTEVGVRSVIAKDLIDAFEKLGLRNSPTDFSCLPEGYQSLEGLTKIWGALYGLIANIDGYIIEFAKQYSLAPCEDNKLRPFASTYVSDEQTRNIFQSILPSTWFLAGLYNEKLAEKLCPKFSPIVAIALLQKMGSDYFEQLQIQGRLDVRQLLKWFRNHRLDDQWLNDFDAKNDFVRLSIFPSKGHLKPLGHLMLPGNFSDPMGLGEIIDIENLEGLKDFLKELGAKELTFVEYVKTHATRIFSAGITNDLKDSMVELLGEHIGEIRENSNIENLLQNLELVRCDDGQFRAPGRVYFRTQETERIFKEPFWFAKIDSSKGAKNITDLYNWLRVVSLPRMDDVISVINRITSGKPFSGAREETVAIVDVIGGRINELDLADRTRYTVLKRTSWLPAENDFRNWYCPYELYASYNKSLFESQAKFLDIPIRIQTKCRDFLQLVGVRLNPEPIQVINHLKKCIADNSDPPNGMYSYLNGLREDELKGLRTIPCLRSNGKYYRPDQVFMGSNPFGRFRAKLDQSVQQYGKFLISIGVKQIPDWRDALQVITEISTAANEVSEQDKQVLFQCWKILSQSLEEHQIDPALLFSRLKNVKCIPNRVHHLEIPPSIFFDDRPALAQKFSEVLGNNIIRKPEHVWKAMREAGVRAISEAISGQLVQPENCELDTPLADLIATREDLIKRVLTAAEGAGVYVDHDKKLDTIRFLVVDELYVIWHLNTIGKDLCLPAEHVKAFMAESDRAIYFTLQNGQYPWSDIARELAIFVAPHAEAGTVSLGLNIVLEASESNEVVKKLDGLGVALTEQFSEISMPGESLNSLDESLRRNTQPEDQATTNQSQQPIIQNREQPNSIIFEDTKNSNNGFAEKMFEAQTNKPSNPSQEPVLLPPGGPKTDQSAAAHTEKSVKYGRSGVNVSKIIHRWEPREAAKLLAQEFKNMALGDYSKRCQICGNTFLTRGGDLQTYVIHLVEPHYDYRTNHFGDLVSLCGLHFAYVKYGQWSFINPSSLQSVQDAKALKELLLNAETKFDDVGSQFISIPIRFYNIYKDWDTNPTQALDLEIRYSIPHWKYLKALLLE